MGQMTQYYVLLVINQLANYPVIAIFVADLQIYNFQQAQR